MMRPRFADGELMDELGESGAGHDAAVRSRGASQVVVFPGQVAPGADASQGLRALKVATPWAEWGDGVYRHGNPEARTPGTTVSLRVLFSLSGPLLRWPAAPEARLALDALFLANAVRPSKINAVFDAAFGQGLERAPTRDSDEWVRRLQEFRVRQGDGADAFLEEATLAAGDLYPGEQEPPPTPQEEGPRMQISAYLRVFQGARLSDLVGPEGFLDRVGLFAAAIGPGLTWPSRVAVSGTARLALSALAGVRLAENLNGIDMFNSDVAGQALVKHLQAAEWPGYIEVPRPDVSEMERYAFIKATLIGARGSPAEQQAQLRDHVDALVSVDRFPALRRALGASERRLVTSDWGLITTLADTMGVLGSTLDEIAISRVEAELAGDLVRTLAEVERDNIGAPPSELVAKLVTSIQKFKSLSDNTPTAPRVPSPPDGVDERADRPISKAHVVRLRAVLQEEATQEVLKLIQGLDLASGAARVKALTMACTFSQGPGGPVVPHGARAVLLGRHVGQGFEDFTGYSALLRLEPCDFERYLLLAAATGKAASSGLGCSIDNRVSQVLNLEEYQPTARLFRRACMVLLHRTRVEKPWSSIDFMQAVVAPAQQAQNGLLAVLKGKEVLESRNSSLVREALGGLFAALGLPKEGDLGFYTIYDRCLKVSQRATAVLGPKGDGLQRKTQQCFNAFLDEAGRGLGMAARNVNPQTPFPSVFVSADSALLLELTRLEDDVERILDLAQYERVSKAPRIESPEEEPQDEAPPASGIAPSPFLFLVS